MIQINHLFLSFGEQVIFNDINWLIPDKSRLALVGNNGEGKTTLLRVMMGITTPDKGTIELPSNQRIGYLPQDLVELDTMPLLDYLEMKSGLKEIENTLRDYELQLSQIDHSTNAYHELLRKYGNLTHRFEIREGYSFTSKIKKTLRGLGFLERDFDKYCTDFSGGWKMRIHLASLLLSQPDILLLDEPTNHLDTESMEWLEDWLKTFEGTFLTISHDRIFLDKMITETVELDRGAITIYPGNYTYFLKEKEIRKEMQIAKKKEQDKKIKDDMSFVERFRYKAKKASQAQSRLRQIEKMEIIEIQEDAKKVHFTFPDCFKSGYETIKVENVSKNYDEQVVLTDITTTIHFGEKIALVGVNGAGKSTFSRLLSKTEAPTSGNLIHGKDVAMGFFAQESAQNLEYKNTIWEEIQNIDTLANDQQKRNLLGAFLFSKDDWYKSISILSGGEKSRLTLCKLLLEKHNLLILDEPTNHLDISTRDMFQEALKRYKGTLILVTHDRYFLDELVHRVIEIRDHKAISYPGNYSYFIRKRAEILADQSNQVFESSLDSNAIGEKSKPNLQKDQKRKEAEKRNYLYQFKKELQDLEKEISKLEQEKLEVEAVLCSQDIYQQGDKIKLYTNRLKSLQEELPAIYDIWHTKQQELEKIEAEYTI